jgi:hypothetical protein
MNDEDREELARLERLFDHLRATQSLDVDRPLLWRYRFDAWERKPLEDLAIKLVDLGYSNLRFDASSGEDCFSLTVEVVETRTPFFMLERERELRPLTFKDGEGQPWSRGMSVQPIE